MGFPERRLKDGRLVAGRATPGTDVSPNSLPLQLGLGYRVVECPLHVTRSSSVR